MVRKTNCVMFLDLTFFIVCRNIDPLSLDHAILEGPRDSSEVLEDESEQSPTAVPDLHSGVFKFFGV